MLQTKTWRTLLLDDPPCYAGYDVVRPGTAEQTEQARLQRRPRGASVSRHRSQQQGGILGKVVLPPSHVLVRTDEREATLITAADPPILRDKQHQRRPNLRRRSHGWLGSAGARGQRLNRNDRRRGITPSVGDLTHSQQITHKLFIDFVGFTDALHKINDLSVR